MWEKILIEGVLHRRSHSIPLSEISQYQCSTVISECTPIRSRHYYSVPSSGFQLLSYNAIHWIDIDKTAINVQLFMYSVHKWNYSPINRGPMQDVFCIYWLLNKSTYNHVQVGEIGIDLFTEMSWELRIQLLNSIKLIMCNFLCVCVTQIICTMHR